MSYILLNLIPFLAYWDSFTLDFCGQLQGLGGARKQRQNPNFLLYMRNACHIFKQYIV